MVKISGFMIGLVVVSLIAAVIGLFVSEVTSRYDVEYDNTTLEAYNKLDSMHTTTEKIKNQTVSIKQKTGILDIVGGFFGDAYNALKLVGESYNAFDEISNAAIENSPLGASAKNFKVAIATIIIILIFVGVIISAIVKKDV